MKLDEITKLLDSIAPLDTQSEWDNSGMQLSSGSGDVKRILVALEISGELIDEAVSCKADLIVTHHPLIFKPLKNIDSLMPSGRYIMRLIKEGIDVYSSHTAFDTAKGGNTDCLMKLMGIKTNRTVTGTEGFLRLGKLPKPMRLAELSYMLADKLKLDGLRFVGDPERKLSRVACCTGAGGDLWTSAKDIADVLVTGDVSHHEAQSAGEAGLAVIDAGHWGTEQIFTANMAAQLRAKLGNKVKVIESEINQDPFNYME